MCLNCLRRVVGRISLSINLNVPNVYFNAQIYGICTCLPNIMFVNIQIIRYFLGNIPSMRLVMVILYISYHVILISIHYFLAIELNECSHSI